ncbi:MAG TPA: acetyltransferase [Pirellulales bacterium]|jgi:sugar O-acyltransferase (sialic acid O-acetyltransferase NeuD family)
MSSASKSPGTILVIGAGGHAKAVVGAAKISGYDVRAIYDDDESKWGKGILGVPIFGPINRILDAPRIPVIVAIADGTTRKAFVERLPLEWGTLIHTTAVIDPTAEISPGTVAFAGVVVQADAKIGPHVILNANATVSHDCVLEEYVHLAPGVDLASGVHVGAGTFFGIGSVAMSGIRVGCWTTVGAGAAVTADLPDRVVAVGCPARIIKSIENKPLPSGVDYR